MSIDELDTAAVPASSARSADSGKVREAGSDDTRPSVTADGGCSAPSRLSRGGDIVDDDEVPSAAAAAAAAAADASSASSPTTTAAGELAIAVAGDVVVGDVGALPAGSDCSDDVSAVADVDADRPSAAEPGSSEGDEAEMGMGMALECILSGDDDEVDVVDVDDSMAVAFCCCCCCC